MPDSCLSRFVVETNWDARAADAEAAYERDEYFVAFRIYLRLAMEGHAMSQHRLAQMFQWGDGVDKDLERAFGWHLSAALAGLTDAYEDVGRMYYLGDGVPANVEQAAYWLRRSAQHGNADAQCGLGRLYETGEGVPRDLRRAVHWYKLAAAQFHRRAIARLAVLTPA